MDCCGNTEFSHVNDFCSVDFMTELEVNLKFFLDYAFLKIGAWQDVTSTDICGVDYSTLNKLEDPSPNPTCFFYGGLRNGWVWEDIDYNGNSPIPVSIPGVDLNDPNILVNYPLGVVKSQTDLGASMQANFSFRLVQTYLKNYSPWWDEFQYNSIKPSASGVQNKDAVYAVFKNHGVQLPAIMIETIPSTKKKPKCLGTTEHWVYQDVRATVIAENSQMRNKLTSILSCQQDKSLYLFNSDDPDIQFPLDCNGQVVNNLNYPDIVDMASWKCARIKETDVFAMEIPCPGLYMSRVRLNFEILCPVKP